MEDIFANQEQLVYAMEQLLASFKKTGRERRTADYIKRKLQTLDEYWEEFKQNRKQLADWADESSEPIKGLNEKAYKNYETARSTLQQYLLQVASPVAAQPESKVLEVPSRGTSPLPIPGPSTSAASERVPKTISQGVNSRTTDMLRKQMTNFKAFSRTANSIDLEAMTEQWQFKDTLQQLQSRWSAIDAQHWELDSELNGSDTEYEKQFTEHENKFKFLKQSISKKMWSTCHREQSTPKLDIPTFSGNYNHWISFKDLFSEAIHNNSSLSPAQKMQFLKSKLTGEAERLIQHLHITSDNYLVSWEILEHRFNNKRLIFTSHINLLLGLPAIQYQSATQLKKLHDTIKECLNALKNLGLNITTWDPLLVHLLGQKLDSESYTEYLETVQNPRELPIMDEFINYLETKFTVLESSRRKQEPKTIQPNLSNIQPKLHFSSKKYNMNNYFNNKSRIRAVHESKAFCGFCKGEHGIFNCAKFQEMPCEQKLKTVTRLRYCVNCLHEHDTRQCFSSKRCRICAGFHNSILHNAFLKSKPSTSSNHVSKIHQASQPDTCEVLLATAMVGVKAANGHQHHLRALIDSGSQISVITERAAQMLGLRRRRCKGTIFGVGEHESSSKGMLTIQCRSLHNDFTLNIDVIIMGNLIKNLPNVTLPKPSWSYIENINLADPDYYIKRPVDILLGAEVYSKILLDGILRGPTKEEPIAQQTYLGWILCGSVKSYQCNVLLHNNYDDMQRFWECEDISQEKEMSSEDELCLQYFSKTTKRLADGRFEVRLPIIEELKTKLGSSRTTASAQYQSLERRLNNNLGLANDYKRFMQEYLDLGHMEASPSESKPEFYLPHHGVTRESSTTTKLRVVFNASAKSSSGYSLNDIMYKGPNLQQDLQQLILKWRQYKFAYTADIEKMYRQIWVFPEDQGYQKVLWRDSKHHPIQTYRLKTVTYGEKPASFLAINCLKQLAADERNKFPEAAREVEESFFVDDFCGGHHSLQQSKQLQADLIELLKSGGFNLRKWKSNDSQLLADLDTEQCDTQTYEFKQVESTKTLGLGWSPQEDVFTFQSRIEFSEEEPTKRSLLSDISKLYDPLGWLTPLSTTLKLLFQNVWLSKIEWDDKLPQDINKKWLQLRSELKSISTFKLQRWIGTSENDKIEFHGFSDASSKAFSAVIYCKVIKNGAPTISLIAAKARLAPLNKIQTIPRLELMGAELLSKLMSKVQKCLHQYDSEVYGWTDSTAVLGWIQGDPARWKTFISNRVRTITQVMPKSCWRYVKTNENPSDSASRGVNVTQLKEDSLWWNGPSWLPSFTVAEPILYETNLELKNRFKQSNILIRSQYQDLNVIEYLLNRHSNITRVIRILAWVLRLTKYKQHHEAYLTLREIKYAKILIVKNVQQVHFNEEIKLLSNQKPLPSKSKILNLNPILDEDRILRVGGRLKYATVSTEIKNPIIIPYESQLTVLLIQQAHELTFHGGPRITLANLRQKFWIIGGIRATKKHIRKCVTCRKHSPTLGQQLMGNLPIARVTPKPAFYNTGVDFTGYLDVKANKGRGIKTTKGYIALFICMVTKAVHLEIVSDLTSSAFLAALSRMAARRGTPQHIFSDNGTNFVGANRLMQEQFQRIFDNNALSEIANMRITWHFNVAKWCQASGLWERNIRSLKHHLRRVVGEQKLTYEEYATLLAKIEAILNSRPLCALTEDPTDLDYLTPAHFLVGRGDLNVVATEQDARSRWYLISKINDDLWKRWKVEYMSQLSVRSKWLKAQDNIQIGDLVTIQDENLPPGKWLMGRVLEQHPGEDGLVRAVTLKTKNGIIKRPVVKLSVLPLSNSVSSDCEEEPKQKQEIQAKSLKQKNFMSMATAFILFMSIITTTYAAAGLPSNMSLYFDHTGSAKIIRDKWTLIAYYNMSPYWEGFTAAKKFINYTDKICTCISDTYDCSTIRLQLQHEFEELDHYNRLLLNQRFSARARMRRALISGVGYAANYLFGVLDERFAEQYKNDIELIRQNEHHINNLIQNQTSVVEAQYNLLKRTEQSIQLQHKSINKNLRDLYNFTNSLKSESIHNSDVQNFILSTITAMNLFQNLKRIQDTILDTITDISHGKFNMHLLTPEQIKGELQIIGSQLTKDITLPIDNIQSDLRNIYSLLRIKARMLKDYFIFEISFPLTNREAYNIYKIISVPKQIAGNAITVIPVDDYVAINLGKDSYFTLSTFELQLCFNNEQNYLCHLNKPIKYLPTDEKFCKVGVKTKQCMVSKSACRDQWIQLNNVSQYFYFCCNSYQVRIICSDPVSSVSTDQLSGAGILHIEPNCMIKGKDFTMYSQANPNNEINLESGIISPKFVNINHLVNISHLQYSQFVDNNEIDINSSLSDLGQQVEELKIATKNLKTSESQISGHDVHQYAISYGLLAVVATAAVLILWRRYRKRVINVTPKAVPSVVFSARKQSTADRQPSEVYIVNTRDIGTSPVFVSRNIPSKST